MVIWTLARKDLRLLVRDARALVILLAMPLILIFILGVSLGEGFGQKAAERLRVSVLNLDRGLPRWQNETATLVGMAGMTRPGVAANIPILEAFILAAAERSQVFPPDSWSALLLKDLAETAEIQIELIANEHEAKRLVSSGRRAAVLVIGPEFSRRVENCSFMKNGINPFFRDGVRTSALDIHFEKDDSQEMAVAIMEQVAQGSLLRIVMPWMIGRAFEKVGDPDFLTLLGKEKEMPGAVQLFLNSPFVTKEQKRTLGMSLKNALQNLFPRYHLTAKTWASLTRETEHTGDGSDKMKQFEEEGHGWLKRGAIRYQALVPSALVTFAFFLVLTAGWLFVAERRQGTMTRLRAAPLARWQILLGKMLPCLAVSLVQGFFLFLAGKIFFDMSWGGHPLWLAAVVICTSLAAMGLALLVASLARTETQVAVYGTLLVLVLALVSGSLIGDRSLMPPRVQQITLFTPHAWALDAYRELLTKAAVDVSKVAMACGVLALFGLGFVLISWWLLKLE